MILQRIIKLKNQKEVYLKITKRVMQGDQASVTETLLGLARLRDTPNNARKHGYFRNCVNMVFLSLGLSI